MPKKQSKPGDIHLRIIEVLKRFPEGASAGQIRIELEKEGLAPGDQVHLERRKRDLKKWFLIEKVRGVSAVRGVKRNVVLYKYQGERSDVTDEGQISLRLRAQVIHAAYGRCEMCGKTIAKHFINSLLIIVSPVLGAERTIWKTFGQFVRTVTLEKRLFSRHWTPH
jgi:hypothetical protein